MDRKVWSDEEKLSVVLALLKGEQTAVEICRQYQISTTQAYRWRDLFLAGGKQALGDGRTKARRDPLVDENRRLKELVGQQALIIDAQKKILGH
jgi:transposase